MFEGEIKFLTGVMAEVLRVGAARRERAGLRCGRLGARGGREVGLWRGGGYLLADGDAPW